MMILKGNFVSYKQRSITLGSFLCWFEVLLLKFSSSLRRISSMYRIDFLLDFGLPLKTSILKGLPSLSKVRFPSIILRYSACSTEN